MISWFFNFVPRGWARDNHRSDDASEPAYVPLNDQAVRDDKAYELFIEDSNKWNTAHEQQTFPFDDEMYSPVFDRREFVGVEICNKHFYGTARNARFVNCYLEGYDFEYAKLEGCLFDKVVATDTALTGATLTDAKAINCSFEGCNFEDILWNSGEIRHTSLSHNVFHEAVFDGSLIEDVTFFKSVGRWTSFDEARMFEIRWRGALFADSSLSASTIRVNPCTWVSPLSLLYLTIAMKKRT